MLRTVHAELLSFTQAHNKLLPPTRTHPPPPKKKKKKKNEHNRSITVSGYIQATTVFVDDDDKLTVEALVTQRYPDGDRLFLDITAKLKVSNLYTL